MTNLRLKSFTCPECADRQYVQDPFGGKDLAPCPSCTATYEPCVSDAVSLASVVEALEQLSQELRPGLYRDGFRTAIDAVRDMAYRGMVDLAELDEEHDRDPAA